MRVSELRKGDYFTYMGEYYLLLIARDFIFECWYFGGGRTTMFFSHAEVNKLPHRVAHQMGLSSISKTKRVNKPYRTRTNCGLTHGECAEISNYVFRYRDTLHKGKYERYSGGDIRIVGYRKYYLIRTREWSLRVSRHEGGGITLLHGKESDIREELALMRLQ